MPAATTVTILGPYRSGTSLTACVLHELGVTFGPRQGMVPADQRNPSGYFERDDINAANTALIESAGGTLGEPGAPETIAANGNLSTLEAADLDWLRNSAVTGIKDPRLCVTLKSWFKAERLQSEQCRFVRVTRDIDRIVSSATNHSHVAAYCDGDSNKLRAMSDYYTRCAEWHIRELGLPAMTLRYEDLIATPLKVVGQIAGFLGIDNKRTIQRAARCIGKQRALSRLRRRHFAAMLRFKLGALRARLLRFTIKS
ncbi:MAG: sulfotransferase [Opitutaceae bacterium]|nr:sulfotransferase [Opitutaceae bacterium]